MIKPNRRFTFIADKTGVEKFVLATFGQACAPAGPNGFSIFDKQIFIYFENKVERIIPSMVLELGASEQASHAFSLLRRTFAKPQRAVAIHYLGPEFG
jgi:hypothetical protein